VYLDHNASGLHSTLTVFQAFNSATDLFLAIFPTVVFWNLNLKLRIKISLMVLLSLGIV
jgi:hypothetical protein